MVQLSEIAPFGARFNEGGADCPPIADIIEAVEAGAVASMKGGRTAPR